MSQIDHAKHIKTIFCDIDGCIFKHHGSLTILSLMKCILLPGVRKAFHQWTHKGYAIILTTGRPESLRTFTEQQLNKAGLYYNHLLMGLPRGQRVIINDIKPESTEKTAECINVTRNDGMKNVNI
jgi:hypothetical protein